MCAKTNSAVLFLCMKLHLETLGVFFVKNLHVILIVLKTLNIFEQVVCFFRGFSKFLRLCSWLCSRLEEV